jgi:hypothetical protein
VLVDIGSESRPTTLQRTPDFVARDTARALALVAAVEGLRSAVELAYRPERWVDDRSAGSELWNARSAAAIENAPSAQASLSTGGRR